MKSFLTSAFILVLLLSCKENKGSDNNIIYAFWGDPEAIGVEQTIIDGFTKSKPDITVKTLVAPYSQYQTKLLTLIGGGQAPDVMRIDSNFRSNFLGVLKDLNPVVQDKNYDLSIFYPEAIEDARGKNGELFGLPWGYAPFYYFINLDILDEYDMEMPSKDWTISEFYRMCEEIYEKSGGSLYGAVAESSFPLTLIYASGTDMYSEDYSEAIFNNSQATGELSRFIELYNKGIFPKDMANSQYKAPDEFVGGKSLFYIQGSSAQLFIFKQANMRFEAWPYPIADDGRRNTTMTKSNIYSLYKETAKLYPAWEFLTYHRGPEGEKFNAIAKRVPPAINDDKLVELYADVQPGKYPQRFIEIYDVINNQGHAHPLQLPQNYGKLNTLQQTYWQKSLLGELSVQDAMDQAVIESNAILSKNLK